MDDLRQTMLEGFAAVLDGDSLTALERLMPNRPWRETVPAEIWYRRRVLDQQNVRQRHELHTALERVVGANAAAATMEYLPPVPWSVLHSEGVRLPDV